MRIGGLIQQQAVDQDKSRAIKEVSKELESFFLYELLKTMRRTVGFQDSFQKDTYTSLFDLELSRVLAERGTGLRDVIERQLSTPSISQTFQNSILPSEGPISSKFGERLHPLTGRWNFHKGVDIAAPEGSPVRAIRDGRVIFSGYKEGYGNLVVIDHGGGLITRYGHNRKNFVKEGDSVNAGDIIAEVGSSGVSTGPHLHFEVLQAGKPVDPEGFFNIKDMRA
ncbi:MAG: peptidoglycan DD-metalloendopeptidase family protein [Thermodesulfovibrionales bacterium]